MSKVLKKAKSFSLSADVLSHIGKQTNQSAYIENLVLLEMEGLVLSQKAAQILAEYRALSGEEPEHVVLKFIRKRIDLLKKNLISLEANPEMLPEIRVGSAFFKLNKSFEKLVAENRDREFDDKIAITFNTLFKDSHCNQEAIRRWIHAHQSKLDDYHRSLGISNPADHNRLSGVRLRVNRQKKLKQEERAKQQLAPETLALLPFTLDPMEKEIVARDNLAQDS